VTRILLVLLLLATAGLAPAAERYNTFLFGVAYYPEQWPESYWERDARMMRDAGVNVVRMGEFAWYDMEPREDVFDFSLFDRAIAVLARHGIKTILGTPTATPPKWLTSRYPEVLAVTSDGRAVDDQTRRHYCYNSPTYRRLSRRIVEQMAQHFRDHPDVIGWQIDNEFNCNLPECYNDSCRIAFREWLRGRYGELHSLNERWGTAFWSQAYDNWGQIDLPFPAPAAHNPALMLDYKRFISDSVISFQHEQTDILRRLHPEDFITHNGTFKNIDYYRFSRDLDIYAHDNYPVFQETPRFPVGAQLTLARGFRGRFLIMEQQTGAGGQAYLLRAPRPGEMSLWAFQALAHGADGMLHFRWRTARRGAEEYWGGVLDQENVPRARYEEFRREGAQIRRLGPELLGSRVVSDIAALKDFEDEWVFDYQYLTREVSVPAEFRDLFQASSELGYNIDFIGRNADFSRYKILFGPHLALMDPDLAQKIRRFVEQGGTFILEAHSAIKDRDNAVLEQPKPAMLSDLFGVTVEDFQCYQPPSRKKNALRFADGAAVPVHVFAETLKPAKARPVATWDGDFLRGTPAMTENRVGTGRAVYYGSFFNVEAARHLIRRYTAAHNLRPLLPGIPAGVEVTRRTKAPNEYYFLLNHGETPAAIKLPPGFFDVLANTPAPAAITLKPFEYKVLRKNAG
jgi:beta-galactosidase